MPIAALAGLGAIADAILAIIVLLAIVGIAYLVQRFGSYIPLIGGWLAAQAVKFMQAAQASLAWFYKGMLWALNTVVDGTVVIITYPLAKVLDVANVTVNALYWLRNVAIPRSLQAAYNFANQVAQYAYAYALALYGQAIAFGQAVAQAAYAYALALYGQAIAFGQAVAQAAYAYAASLYRQSLADLAALEARVGGALAALASATALELASLRQWTAGLVSGAVGVVEADIATAEQRLTALIQRYAQAAVKDTITLVDGAAVVALTDIWPDLATDVDALLHDIPQELIDIRDELAAIPRAIPGDLLSALSALGVLAIPLLRYLRECGVPMCRDLHGLSDLFNDLLTVETDLALLDLVTMAARSPRQAAALVMNTLAPIARETATITRDLAGV